MKSHLFLRVYEIKDKFRYLIKEDPQKKKVMRDLSSCITERFNGFNRELRREMSPIDILYKTWKKQVNVDCFFTNEINLPIKLPLARGKKSDTERLFNAFNVQITMGEKMFGRSIWSIVPVVRGLFIILTLEAC